MNIDPDRADGHDNSCEQRPETGGRPDPRPCPCADRRNPDGPIDPRLLKMRVKRVRQAEAALAAVKRTLTTYVTERAPSRCEFHPLCGRERDGVLISSCGHSAVMCAHHGSEILRTVQASRETTCTKDKPLLHELPAVGVTLEWCGL